MAPEQPAATPSPSRSRASLSFGLLTFAALELWLWFGTAGLDYERGGLFPFRTAGWFKLSQIFVLPASATVAWIAAFLFKLWPRMIACMTSVGAAASLGLSIYDAMPQQRLSMLIGHELAQHAQIQRMQLGDSFCDGSYSDGFLVIGPGFIINLLADTRFEPFKPPFDNYLLTNLPAEQAYSMNEGTFYKSKRVEVRVTPDGKSCFYHYSEYVPRD